MDLPSILLIDDDENYVSQMKVILEYEGYCVDYAYNAKDGLIKLEPGKYMAIITDYIMPIIKGDEFAIKAREIDSEARIILLTGYKHGMPPEKFYLFTAIFEKPVYPRELLSILSEFRIRTPLYVNVGVS
jgi:DNA-binding response OmpR family regulator